MDDERFWALIDEAMAREIRAGTSRVVVDELLDDVLVGRLRPDEVVGFTRHADVIAGRAATWDLLAACHLIDGWHSEDGFRDFRDFLILAGQAVFERAVQDADSLAEHAVLVQGRRDGRLAPGPVDDLAQSAWARLTGLDDEDDWFEAIAVAATPEVVIGSGAGLRGSPWESWSRSSYERRLPALVSLVGLRP